MTGQDFQDKLDAIVADLQTKGKGQTANFMFRNSDNTPNILQLSSTPAGVVNAAQLTAIQNFIQPLISIAEDVGIFSVPVDAAREAFKTASAPHQALSDAASLARKNYNDAILADPDFQSAKTALDTAQQDGDYTFALGQYKDSNVSENYSELQAVKGKYEV